MSLLYLSVIDELINVADLETSVWWLSLGTASSSLEPLKDVT